MEYESLEEKQQAFDAWKAGQSKPKPRVVPDAPLAKAVKTGILQQPAAAKTPHDEGNADFAASLSIIHMFFLGMSGLSFIALLWVIFAMDLAGSVRIYVGCSLIVSTLFWASMSHILRLLEKIYWRLGGR